MNEADVLDKAADYIEQYGWVQGSYGGGGRLHDLLHAPACASGAMDSVVEDIYLAYRARDVLAVYLGGYDKIKSVPTWNDKPERTAEEVIRHLRGAAKEIRNNE